MTNNTAIPDASRTEDMSWKHGYFAVYAHTDG